MSEKKAFTMRDRRSEVGRDFGHRPVNNWGDGDLPAPWAIGDVVRLKPRESYDAEFLGRLRMGINGRAVWHDRGQSEQGGRIIERESGFFLVVTAYSIDEGDAWYFRVYGDGPYASDRMHVAHPSRASRHWRGHAVNYMAAFDLVDSADPDGLALRRSMLAAGWKMPRPRR